MAGLDPAKLHVNGVRLQQSDAEGFNVPRTGPQIERPYTSSARICLLSIPSPYPVDLFSAPPFLLFRVGIFALDECSQLIGFFICCCCEILRSPAELACAQSLLPLHSAVSAARLTSCLSTTSRSCRALSQGTLCCTSPGL